jgi:hypothetical protein
VLFRYAPYASAFCASGFVEHSQLFDVFRPDRLEKVQNEGAGTCPDRGSGAIVLNKAIYLACAFVNLLCIVESLGNIGRTVGTGKRSDASVAS